MNHPELHEQKQVVKFLNIQRMFGRVKKFTSIPNSTFTKSWSEVNRIAASGLNPGLPDLFIILASGLNVWIEMKRPRRVLKNGSLGSSPSTIKPEQIDWIKTLNQSPNTEAHMCFGAKEAIDYLTYLIGDVSTPQQTHEDTNKAVSDFSSFLLRKKGG